VIVVAGSYGKTSTKEAIAAVLSEKFKVLKTPGGVNVDIGIARQVLAELSDDTDIYVVEAGAYVRGEIKAVMEMVQPQIGVLTGINEQHLELFGSIENTIAAKSEVVLNLPENGTAFVNIANANVANQLASFQASGREIHQYSAATPSENSEVAKMIGVHFGLTDKYIATGLESMEYPEHRLRTFVTSKGYTVIDDTYNSNPSGFRVALEQLRALSVENRIVITTGVYELGTEADVIHKGLDSLAQSIADHVYLVEPAHISGFPSATVVGSVQTLLRKIESYKPEETAILLEGRHRTIVEIRNYLHEK
jgi:UDP-N-acetylmuramoyl-tripeptide--D-alanyl-D-alanine ligase